VPRKIPANKSIMICGSYFTVFSGIAALQARNDPSMAFPPSMIQTLVQDAVIRMAASLEILDGSPAPRTIEIGNTATIGRSIQNDVVLPAKGLVSRQHAVIRCHQQGHFQIMDLGSRNGTFVNGRRVVLPANLEDESVIRIGDCEIRFRKLASVHTDGLDAMTIGIGTTLGLGRPENVAVLVCDIRSFSHHSERLPADRIARVLGAWCRDAGAAIHSGGGVVDKFIGDAVLAYWIDPGNTPETCAKAMCTAESLLELAATRSWPDGGQPFDVGIALHYGSVTTGNIGIVAQRDATIVGDNVNIVFRLEGLMKQLNERILLSGDLADRLPDRSRLVDRGAHLLKGRTRAVRVFAVSE
jgi:adenylate cyclase